MPSSTGPIPPKPAPSWPKQPATTACVKGASDLLDDATKKNFAEAYPEDALDNLWWYVSEPAWFVPGTEYRDKYRRQITAPRAIACITFDLMMAATTYFNCGAAVRNAEPRRGKRVQVQV
jgi:hypothetical protein